jgi:hypothetical protein
MPNEVKKKIELFKKTFAKIHTKKEK